MGLIHGGLQINVGANLWFAPDWVYGSRPGPHTGLPLPWMKLKTALDLLQFQADYRQTAAKSAADHRFLVVDLALVIPSRDVPRTVWRAAPLRGEQFLSGIR